LAPSHKILDPPLAVGVSNISTTRRCTIGVVLNVSVCLLFALQDGELQVTLLLLLYLRKLKQFIS